MSTTEILERLSKGELTTAEATKLLAKANEKPLTFKVSPKGAISVYGMGRFPVTLYGDQWSRILDKAGDLRKFIDDNRHRLAPPKAA